MNRVITLIAFSIVFVTPASAEIKFRKQVIDTQFKAESCAAADINGDGKIDIVAGENWYEAPTWKPHKFRELEVNEVHANTRCDYADDFNDDGLPDIATANRGRDIFWLENPGDKGGLWKSHPIGDCRRSKAVIFADVDGDGKGDFIVPYDVGGKSVVWWKAQKDPYALWKMNRVGTKGGDLHGLGLGDINRDGRNDILTRFGWYEAPADPAQGQWKFHDLDRGQIHHSVVYDFDGDGDQDIAAGAPHNYGLFWWEQSEKNNKATWQKHTIDKTISQMNTVISADFDNDGDMDLLSGKRYYAHGGKDPGADEPVYLVWYELQRDGKQARFIRHIIDDNSGVGYMVTPIDIDNDGDTDIVTSSKKGVLLFENLNNPTWLPLFNGKNLDNWIGEKNLWSVEGDTIVGKTETGIKHNSFLISRDKYDNFVLTCQVKLVPDTANSGIQFRSTPREHGEVEGYQADIGVGWWGSIYEELGRKLLNNGYKNRGQKAVIKNGWNDYVVYAVGDEFRVEINGTVCTHLKDDVRKTGIIAPQLHSGGPTEVRFKNIKLRKVH